MNAIPTEAVELEQNNTEVVHEGEEGLVEMGSASEVTKGHPFGPNGDNGYPGFSFN